MATKRKVKPLQDSKESGQPHENGDQEKEEEEKLEENLKTAVSNETQSKMMRLFGFELSDLSSWNSIVKLLNRPTDPSSLGITRFFFGLLMMCDVQKERGFAYVDFRWGDEEECRFPLFNFLAPLPLEWMYIVYLGIFLGALGIMLGLFYRFSCLLFATCYWYIFLLDKTVWNNHSYLYGLVAIMMLCVDGNRYMSLDGKIRPKIKNAQVPLWNYTLLRTQFFLVYFIAGLKKLDMDWVDGYSMAQLSKHWVFRPFLYVLTYEEIDLWIVHRGGLALDLFIGYLLFFDITRPIAFFFGGSFHFMNSQMFSIGMFPYTMLATMPIFCYANWPRWLMSNLPVKMRCILSDLSNPQISSHCVYGKEIVKPEETNTEPTDDKEVSEEPLKKEHVIPKSKPGWTHHWWTLFTLGFIATQMFLPYSHFLTKGYNTWTNGLYGYSWDMMVHSWSTQHVRITYVDKTTGKKGFINPEAYTRGSMRWTSHADMVKQYATCIHERLQEYNMTDIELYFDIWRSLNDRFQQRMFNPNVDILAAEWHPFKEVTWKLPLLTELSDWREKLDTLEKEIYKTDHESDIIFVADFPGLSLENFIHADLGNTTLSVLKGEVAVEAEGEKENFTIKEGEKLRMQAGAYHTVHTVTDNPSCYMYLFVNTTEKFLLLNISIYERKLAAKELQTQEEQEKKAKDGVLSDSDIPPVDNKATKTDTKTDSDDENDKVNDPDKDTDPLVIDAYNKMKETREKRIKKATMHTWERFTVLVGEWYTGFSRSAAMTGIALKSIIFRQSFEEAFNSTYDIEDWKLGDE